MPAPPLLFKDLLNLPDFLLDFASDVLGFAFGLYVRIVGDLAGLLLDFAFHLVKLAFNLILRARLHLFLSLIIEIRLIGRGGVFRHPPRRSCNSRSNRAWRRNRRRLRRPRRGPSSLTLASTT